MPGSRSLGALVGMIRHFTTQGVVRGVQKGWGTLRKSVIEGPAAGPKGGCGSPEVTGLAVSSPELPSPAHGP